MYASEEESPWSYMMEYIYLIYSIRVQRVFQGIRIVFKVKIPCCSSPTSIGIRGKISDEPISITRNGENDCLLSFVYFQCSSFYFFTMNVSGHVSGQPALIPSSPLHHIMGQLLNYSPTFVSLPSSTWWTPVWIFSKMG